MSLEVDQHLYDVIIMGGGVSGLRAATLLAAQSKSVLVLESRDRVGGRINSVEFDGYRWDIGGQWVGPAQKRLLSLIQELGQSTFPQQQQGKKVVEINGVFGNYTGTIPPLGMVGLIESQVALYRLERMAQTIDPQCPWDHKNAEAWDNISAQAWVDKNIWTELARKMIHIAVTSVFSTDPKEISFLYLLHVFRASGGVMRTLEVPNGAQQDRILGSAHQLSLTMAERLGGDTVVRLNHKVSDIDTTDPSKVTVTCSNGKRFFAKRLVSSIPPILLTRINFEPQLPMARQHLNQRMFMGMVIKFIIFYDTCFWRTLGFAGEILSDRHSVSICFDASFVDGSRPSIVGFFEGGHARVWSDKTQEERKAEVIDLLFKSFNDERAKHPINYLEKDWMKESESLGGYAAICPPGLLTSVGKTIREPIGRIHFAGTETATDCAGYIEGAIQSAERVTAELLPLL
ncbi:amine oxidase [Heterostelium album PN500]|uniref:Amine oxidase n=1 Tax=Heterostelium pallidum (strain ATCC 26659 / Pp 5 / PN500) TaxID=670386 RepID=D3BL05_HETP5|nr:amine oxidase [Heterostelium album PN500]EFA78585.1 amine oxidase [Heterostelium album PN500]|eukprot:XP_020430709.1 amine oxidase [Heterostelium album PN500]